MQKKILCLALTLMMASSLAVNAQDNKQDSPFRRWYVGSSLFMLGNF